MKRTIERITRTAMLAVAIMLCSTSAWATASLEETGGIVTTSDQLAFKNVTLSQLVDGSVRARMVGAAIDCDGKEAVVCHFTKDDEDSPTYVRCEVQVQDGATVKGCVLKFTQSGSDVNVRMVAQKYDSNSTAGEVDWSSVADDSWSYDYNVISIRFMDRETLLQRSINVNFYNSEHPLDSESTVMVGMLESAVPANLWDNVLSQNTDSPQAVNVLDTSKSKSSSYGVTLSISGAYGGGYRSTDTSNYGTDVRAYYVDDANADGYMTPTITVTGIPFSHYKVYVYHSSDTNNRKFGYDTINGTDYYYENDSKFDDGVVVYSGPLAKAWGGASMTELYEGKNCLVVPNLSGSTLTIVGHDASNNNDYRSCTAAIQILEIEEPEQPVIAKPVAIWNGDFPTTSDATRNQTRGGHTISLMGNTSDGSELTIASSGTAGVRIEASSNTAEPIATVFGVKGFPTGNSGTARILATVKTSGNNDRAWAGVKSSKFTFWENGGGGKGDINRNWPGTGLQYFGMIHQPYSISEVNGTVSGTLAYINGYEIFRNPSLKTSSQTIGGITIGSQYNGTGYRATGWTVPYVALIRGTVTPESVAYWSLTDMTAAENITLTDGAGALTGGDNVGVNLAGGTVTITGAKTAAAIFVQADTTLKFAPGATLTIGGGNGPLYVADNARLAIDVSDYATPALNTAVTLISGKVFGKDRVYGKVPTPSLGVRATDNAVLFGNGSAYKYWKWTYANPSRVLTWTGTASNTHTANTTTYKLFDVSTGADTDTSYTYNTDPEANWEYLCHTKSSYVAPGTVLRFKDPVSGTVNKNIANGFNPLTLGGLIVESSGYSFSNDGRPTVYGANSFDETWFAFSESFEDKRTGKFNFVGAVNIDVAADKTFEIKSSNGAYVYSSVTTVEQPVGTAGGTLKMHGAGNMKVSKLTAESSTLDYSDLAANRATAFIDGGLVVNDSTKFKFPANVVFPYPVATSVSGSISDSAPYYVGDTAYTGLAFSNGKAYPKTVRTVSGDASWAAEGWAPGYGGASDMGEAECTVNVTANATLNLGTASAGKVKFNLTTGVTLNLDGTLAANEIEFTGSGKVVCSAADTLQGTIKGGANITIEYPEHILPTGAVWTDASAWQGTIILKNCGHLKNSDYESTANYQRHYRVPFEEYGNASSKIKAPGFKGYAAVIGTEVDAKVCQAELVIDAETTVEFNHGWTAQGYTHFYSEDRDAGFKFVKLSGDGHLKLDGDTDFAQYVFCDVSGFHGSVNITRPSGGGRKSFLFGVPAEWEITGSEYPANLVIASSMTVAANKTWEVPAGIILRDNPTLTLSNGSTISHLSPASEGTLAVAANATATLRNDADSVLTTTLDITTKLDIGSGATLNISDRVSSPLVTTITIPADATGGTYVNTGTLNLGGCTSLTILHLVLGSSTGFADLNTAKLVLPSSCKTIVYDVGTVRSLSSFATGYNSGEVATWLGTSGNAFYYQATETLGEYSAKVESNAFTMNDVPNGADVKLKRYNGTIVEAVPPSEGSSQRVYWKGSVFSGAACWHEWDFEQTTPANTLNDSGVATSEDPGGVSAVALTATHSADAISYVDDPEQKRYIPISEYPYPSASLDFGSAWSAAVRCKMPSGQNKVAVAFGDTSNGILGLATGGRTDMVELFNWTSDGGGTYTTLAQLAVESASTAMHIYVLAVTEDSGTKYVSLYRDGEMIHTAAFSVTSITGFKVGDVIYTDSRPGTLPAVADSGYVDYVRLYDTTVDSSIAEGLSQRRPFVSAIDLFERELTSLTPENWSATDAWEMTPGGGGVATIAAAPTDDANVTVTMANGSSLELNIASDAAYGTLIFNGSGAADLRQDAGTHGRIAADMLVVRSGLDLTVDWNVVGRSEGPAFNVAGVDSGAKLTFDFTDYFTVNEVRATTVITLIGNVPACAYDDSADDRIEVLMPEPLPAYIQSAATTTTPGMYAYKVTITPDHNAGSDVYYKDGDFTDGMTVYTVSELTEGNETIPLDGDTVVVSRGTTVTASIDDSFSNNICVTNNTTLNLTSTETAALNGQIITVDTGSTVNFKGGSFGDITLAGSGTITFTEDTTVESLSGSVSISVAAGKELTLKSIPTYYSGEWHGSWITGGVTGTGTVRLPVINGNYGVKFNDFGTSGSTVAIADGTTAWFYQDTDSEVYIRPALRLDGSFVIQGLSNWRYHFEKITGSGSITFPDSNSPTSITIDEIADYRASTLQIVNNLDSEKAGVTITKISLPEDVAGGVRILRKTGKVTVSSVYVDDVVSSMPLAYTSDGVYRAVAAYDDFNYPTIADAITAATDEHLDDITVLDDAATVPEGYYLSGAAGSKEVALCAARSGEPGSYIYYNDVYAIYDALRGQVMPVLTILDGNGSSYHSTLTGYVSGLTYDSEHSTLFVAVAAIGDEKYLSLTSAVEAATDGQTIALLSNSSEAITLNKSISLSGATRFHGALWGNGTITLDALPSSTIVANDWCGTVVLPEITGDLIVDRFGVSGSTIELTSMTGSFNKDSWSVNTFEIAPNIKISGPCTVNLEADGIHNVAYTFSELSGTGNLTFTGSAAQINITKLTGYTGVLAYNNQSPAVRISAIDFATRPVSDAKILSISGTGTVTVANVTVNGVAPSPALRWVRRRNGSSGDGFYIQSGTIFSVY